MNVAAPFRVMRRFVSVLGLIAAAILLAGCGWLDWFGSKKFPDLPAIKNSPIALGWSTSVGKSADYLFVPGIGDRVIFAASANGTVTALADEGGRVVNSFDTKAKVTAGAGAAEELIVVADRKGEVLAYHPTGRALWKASLGGEVLAPPVVSANAVIVRTSDGRILSLGRGDGKTRWAFQRTVPALTLRTNASVTINRGVLYAGYPGGRLVAVELDSGRPVWEATLALPRGSTELERIADVAGHPVVDDTRVCAAVYQGRIGCVETLSGNVLWTRDISSDDGVAIDAKHVYATDAEGNMYAFDKTSGTTVWKLDKLAKRDPGTPLLVKNALLAGDSAGMVHSLSLETGDLTGRVATDGSPVVSMIAYRDRAIAQTAKGGVFSIEIR